MTKTRKLFYSGLVVLFGIAFFFVAFEIGLRIALRHSMNFDVEMWKYARQIKRVAANPLIGHEHIPGAGAILMGVPVQINSKKLRDREFPYEKSPSTYRVLMLGDSVTFGWGVKAEETLAKRLEARLGPSSARPVEVINTGVGNYNTEMEVEYFIEEGHKYSPDLVLLNYFINDAEPRPTRKSSPLLEWSYVYVYLSGGLDILARKALGRSDWKSYYRDLYAPDSPGWKIAADNIRRLSAFCRERGIKLAIVHLPELHELAEYAFPDVTRLIESLAAEVNAPFIDLTPAVANEVPATLWVSPMDAHPNGKATRLFAEELGKSLKARGLVP